MRAAAGRFSLPSVKPTPGEAGKMTITLTSSEVRQAIKAWVESVMVGMRADETTVLFEDDAKNVMDDVWAAIEVVRNDKK